MDTLPNEMLEEILVQIGLRSYPHDEPVKKPIERKPMSDFARRDRTLGRIRCVSKLLRELSFSKRVQFVYLRRFYNWQPPGKCGPKKYKHMRTNWVFGNGLFLVHHICENWYLKNKEFPTQTLLDSLLNVNGGECPNIRFRDLTRYTRKELRDVLHPRKGIYLSNKLSTRNLIISVEEGFKIDITLFHTYPKNDYFLENTNY